MEVIKVLNPLGLRLETEALQSKQTRSHHRPVI